MKNINLYGHIHFIGIGGVSMKNLAYLSHRLGIKVSGSDKLKSKVLDTLNRMGINAYSGSNVDVVAQSNLVVYTSAIKNNDIELVFAKSKGIECVERKVFLAKVSEICNQVIAVAGSHGKTTVTSMLCHLMDRGDIGFVGHIGGDTLGVALNLIDTGRDYFVTEACEYKRSFLTLSPNIAIITSCDFDHPDCYDSQEQLIDAYSELGNLTSNYIIIQEDWADKLVIKDRKKIITYGFGQNNNYYAQNLCCTLGKYSYDLFHEGQFLGRINLNNYGKFNVLNSLATIIVADIIGIPISVIVNALGCYAGVERRFECVGVTSGNNRIVVDYAHHPNEVQQSIITAREMSQDNLVVIFQPHTYSRTKALYNEFLECFDKADRLIILPTYSAREKTEDGYDAEHLYLGLSQNQKNKSYKNQMSYFASLSQCSEYIKKNIQDSLVLILGAGDIVELSKQL